MMTMVRLAGFIVGLPDMLSAAPPMLQIVRRSCQPKESSLSHSSMMSATAFHLFGGGDGGGESGNHGVACYSRVSSGGVDACVGV